MAPMNKLYLSIFAIVLLMAAPSFLAETEYEAESNMAVEQIDLEQGDVELADRYKGELAQRINNAELQRPASEAISENTKITVSGVKPAAFQGHRLRVMYLHPEDGEHRLQSKYEGQYFQTAVKRE